MIAGSWKSISSVKPLLSNVIDTLSYEGKYNVFKNEDSWLIINCKIYNLEKLGIDPNNIAESLFKKYKENDYKFFSQLNGSFICIIKDKSKIIVVRDHHGVGDQFYYNEKFFATSLSLLSKISDTKLTPDLYNLSRFLTIGYIDTPNSSIKGVKKLSAGSALIYQDNSFKEIPLYNTDSIKPSSKIISVEEACAQYGELHKQSIQRRIEGCNNVGILLSGGYDSGCNLAALRNFYNGDIYSFSIGFKGDNWTELPLARCMSERFNTIHHEYEIDGSEISSLPEIVRYLGDPFVEGGLMVNYCVMNLIGDKKPDVILGGDGSDQYFGTSGREVALHYLSSKYKALPLLKMVYNILNSKSFDNNTKPYRVRFHLDKIINILHGDLFGIPSFLLKELVTDKSSIYNLDKIKANDKSFDDLYIQHKYKSDIEKIINQVILFKASKMASMFDNNLTFPYMDNELYDFLQQLPVNLQCKGDSAIDLAKGKGIAKFLLKNHYKPMLPTEITQKKKQGGFAPMPIFFKDKAQRARINDFIMSSAISDSFLNKNALNEFVTKYDKEASQEGNWFWYKQNKSIQYFNLLALTIWWEEFIENKSVKL